MQGSRGTWKWVLTLGAGFTAASWFAVTPAHADNSKFIEMNTLSQSQLSASVDAILADSSKFTAGDLIVKYKPGTDAAKIAGKHAASVQKSNKGLRLGKLALTKNANLKQTYMDLVNDPDVEYVQPNYKYDLTATPNDPSYSLQWSLPKMHVPEAWDKTQGDSSMVIAVVDTGVLSYHPDLSGSLLPGYNAITNDGNYNDDNGHGTHVAGIAAGMMGNGVGISGVAGHAKILPVKAMSASGSGSDLDIAEGITWAADHGAKVINLSLGSASFSQTMQDAINYAYSKGCLIVAAAGNDNSSALHYPGADEHVLCVMATTETNTKATFSNYGSYVDIAAPGTNIYATTYDGAYGYKQGTSMASPNVAGVAALVWNYRPTLTNFQLERVLESSALDLGTAGKDTTFGYGLVNAFSAMTAAVDTTPIGLTLTGVTPNPFAPTGSNVSTFSYSIAEPGNVTLKVLDASGNVVRTLLNNSAVTVGAKSVTWDGKNDAKVLVAEGEYTFQLTAVDSWGNSATPLTRTISVDRTAPVISGNTVSANPFVPTGTNTVGLTYALSEPAKVTVGIYNSANALVKTLVTNVQQSAGANSLTWDGKNSSGVLAPDGIYTYKITATDAANLSAVAVSGAVGLDRFKPSITAVSDTPDPFKVTGTANSTIAYTLSEESTVDIKIYDASGTLVRTLQNAKLPSGAKTVAWNGKNDAGTLVADGIYTYKINATDSFNNQAAEVTGTITTDKTTPSLTLTTSAVKFGPGSETLSLNYTLSEKSKVTTTVTNSAGAVVRTLENAILKDGGSYSVPWDGKNASGVLVPDGVYTVKVTATDLVGWVSNPVSATVTTETGAAKVTNLKATPNPFKVTGTTLATFTYTLSEDATVSLKVTDSNSNAIKTLVNGVLKAGAQTVTWNGKTDAGILVDDKEYTYTLTATDAGGNVTTLSGTIKTDKTAPTLGNLTFSLAPPDSITLAVDLSEDVKLTAGVYNNVGALVRNLTVPTLATAGTLNLTWDGKTSAGQMAPDGTYTFKLTGTDAAGWVTNASAQLYLETGAPKLTALSNSPLIFRPTGTNLNTLAFTLSEDATLVIKVADSNGNVVRTLYNAKQTPGAKTIQWNGKTDAGVLVGTGVYTYKIDAVDLKGNVAATVTSNVSVDVTAPTFTTPTFSVNPFHPTTGATTALSYNLSEDATVTVTVVNASGAAVKTLLNGVKQSAGSNTVAWDGKNSSGVVLAAGTYTVKLRAVDAVGLIGETSFTIVIN
ncbi:S8 family serine peptidase [Tumebacillus sp. ITR2]|uniref:S8 family serine peptidase n=1 Tax=Tumebacillus amylolyticus TaxID=2801339 RepID=A0ABS1J7A9_9BACL|nr:FlgD immunoglobulin-like domain containing protein [Tumebacillus amylolyticus]MBL0385939.1 S8 family serine peptidase [Tumebacillus amylolyticus]